MTRPLLIPGILLVALAPAGAADKDVAQGDSYIKVEVKGKLQTGVIAIGGETTGTELQTKGGAMELDLTGDRDLRARAEKLCGRMVLVKGELTIRRGVEKPLRLIVKVASLQAAERDK
jgi:hypothetical protein